MPTVVNSETVAKRKSTHLTMRSSRYLLPLAVSGFPAAGACRLAGLAPRILSRSNAVHL